MEINVREWRRADLPPIQADWLEFCRQATRSDMRLKQDAEPAMAEWLSARFEERSTFGFVAEHASRPVGFLIGRINDWESAPPVVAPRKLGIIDAVHVKEGFRRRGVGSRLIDRAIQVMRTRNVTAVETIYDAWNDAAAETWRRAGFAPWMVHAYRML
jgi:GNAT superfamily N-acetyltransferase